MSEFGTLFSEKEIAMEIVSREDLQLLIARAMSVARYSKEVLGKRPGVESHSNEVAAPIAAVLVQEALHDSKLRDIILGVRPELLEVKEMIKKLDLEFSPAAK
ncbi:hypothetical protein HKL94_02095 [Candidatus Parcubacteria bacterium]|nr:hypothetical protein [Candidatus Parcubacteria bacterium]